MQPVHSDLRAATSHLHRRLDARLPFFTTDIAVYRRIMQAYYGFYLPFEALLAEPASNIPGMGWAQRLKTPTLKQDLLALGLTDAQIAALPLCQNLPVVETHAQALGALYVVEGATLGGQALRPIIKAKVGVEFATGGAFMDVYGVETRHLWQVFLACLSCVHEAEDIAQTVAVAQQTFICFEGWLELSGVL
ncbi:biliverdin-producing heme oxygenase [Pseudomonas sp. CCI1.2]|uniref:biliverdin-producing heme oxygenase n=1 Tax=Pseudomonas sp. CCI1.2 TaxID=3048614 RepID=UPI002B2381CE|nr:biliverdin-producing heme oxygenase [Pseudomonas sp. CCI1.2]MEB0090735.1 biliverdin-producing heme oxygenase [Pseudomonas sp. CCI4.2]MEB0121355.1 biliverdin-producing heme oxygenase [Pseudomonas sp. CCI1.2]MEB0157973.1 biliverdin-producing heme oxygenase [Pseudomonas sp. AH2 (2023)]